MKKTIQIIARAMLWPILKRTIRIKYSLYGVSGRKAGQCTAQSGQIQELNAESKRIRIRLHETEQLVAAVKGQQQNSIKELVKKKGFGNIAKARQTLKIILLILLISAGQLHALNAQVSSDLKPLKIGDKVPDITIKNIINYKSSSAKLSDFKGKLLILDFYATWCSPCVTMIPRMDSLQKQFAGRVQFLSITTQNAVQVKAFKEKLEKQKNAVYTLPEVVEDKVLHRLFSHSTLPHYVWVDQEGIIRSITEFKEVNEQNIQKFLDEGMLDVRVKKDTLIAFDRNKPFLIGNNGGNGSKLVYHSVLTDYTPGLGVGLMIWRDSTGMKIMARNLCLAELYRLSFRENGRYLSLKKAELNVKDPSKLIVWKFGKEYEDWLQDKNGYSYELIVPPELASQAYSMMQQDLERLFPAYSATVEKRKTLSLVLISTSDSLNYKSAGAKPEIRFDPFGCTLVNVPIDRFVNRIKMQYMQGKYPEVLNETGYSGNVDLSVNASLSDLKALNRELEKYNLRFIEAERNIETLVIRDRGNAENKISGVDQ